MIFRLTWVIWNSSNCSFEQFKVRTIVRSSNFTFEQLYVRAIVRSSNCTFEQLYVQAIVRSSNFTFDQLFLSVIILSSFNCSFDRLFFRVIVFWEIFYRTMLFRAIVSEQFTKNSFPLLPWRPSDLFTIKIRYCIVTFPSSSIVIPRDKNSLRSHCNASTGNI